MDDQDIFNELLESSSTLEYYSSEYLHDSGDIVDRLINEDLIFLLPDDGYLFSEDDVTFEAYVRIDEKLFYRATLSTFEEKLYFRLELIGDHCDSEDNYLELESVEFEDIDFEYIYQLENSLGELRLPAKNEEEPDILVDVHNITFNFIELESSDNTITIEDGVCYINGLKVYDQEAQDNMHIFGYVLDLEVLFKEIVYFNLKNIAEGIDYYTRKINKIVYITATIPELVAHGNRRKVEYDKVIINNGDVFKGALSIFPVKSMKITAGHFFTDRVLKILGG
jgi:hypothetical protein